MSERLCWLAAGVSFHLWVVLMCIDATTSNQCFAVFALTVVWFATAVYKMVLRTIQ